MQEKNLDSIVCTVKTCPAIKSPHSPFGYCPVHNRIATDPEQYQLALDGKLNAALKAFAKEISVGIYPRKLW
jgi:hypothetical protein